MRGVAISLSIMMISFCFAGCTSSGETEISEDPVSDIIAEETHQEANNNPEITSASWCRETNGIWIESSLECHYDSEGQNQPQEDGPIYIPPCNISASQGLNPTANPSPWPDIKSGHWLEVDGLTDVSHSPVTIENGTEPIVDYRLDYQCGYTYSVKVPAGYNASNEYPLFLYLHGQLLDTVFFNNMITNNFHIPEDDKYIIARPSKLEPDWDPKKALDVLEDVKSHLSVDDDRVYLTGLSMGGRGTFIVASALPDYFAAIMPLSPHHEPYSYLPLASDVAHLPIWMSHGTSDNTSSFEMAEQMAGSLIELGAEIEFHPVVGGDHGGWFAIYSNHSTMEWMLSHVRGK